MDPHISSIAALAWCRALGLPDHALAEPGCTTRIDDSADEVRLLVAGASTAIVGPSEAVSRLEAAGDHADLDAPRAESLVGGHAGRTELLCLCTDWVDATRVENPLISHDPGDLAELLRRCPPDDATETELTASPPTHAFVLLDDDHRPLAGAAHRELGSLLADVRVVAAPEVRRLGLAATVTTLATHDALDSGLVPLARVRRDNRGARAVAAVSGYDIWGTLVTVRLSPGR
ncbi:GNAT family N-acetyltransferase [Rhodococcus sp. Z13]|uniref:GNAT family N-acetyltransferase n=1 Tax=Rhodococcus sacchari TaxID=2962047 RepID=A0ACD4DJ84_9NOCA|nr:GNAT family N-acetyltransferase [Rhodococcus sp. Z13]UYP20102.1 GNAT family N-acetyltransferase [Rhodococcus sp. Z13]